MARASRPPVEPSPHVRLGVQIATSEHVDAIASLIAKSTCKLEGDCARRVRAELDNPDKLLVVALVEGDVIGWARACYVAPSPFAAPNAAPEGWYLMGLFIDRPWRRHGLGAQLTAARLEWLARHTGRVLYIAEPGNQATRLLHDEFGFDLVCDEVLISGDVGQLYVREF